MSGSSPSSNRLNTALREMLAAQVAAACVAVGCDIDSRVLARAVRMQLEGRLVPNGLGTVVFA